MFSSPSTQRPHGRVNYRQIGGADGLLARRLGFANHGSMRATYDREGNYIVFSYATEIARVDPEGNVTHNEEKYSQTTSRQQNLCRAWL